MFERAGLSKPLWIWFHRDEEEVHENRRVREIEEGSRKRSRDGLADPSFGGVGGRGNAEESVSLQGPGVINRET